MTRVEKMRNLSRNQRTVYYAETSGVIPIYDSEGYDTGEKDVVSSTPVAIRIRVTPPVGDKTIYPFGENAEYDRVMITQDTLPIAENTILWVEQSDPQKPHDYIVVRVAPDINVTQYAIRRVNIAELASRVTTIEDTSEGAVVLSIVNTEGSESVLVANGTLVSGLLGSIEATDGSDQSYEVKDSEDELKGNSEALVTGDVLIVTAEEGIVITQAEYSISVDAGL